MTDLRVRRVTGEDLPAAYELSRISFGGEPTPPDRMRDLAGVIRWGVFAGDGRLLAKLSDRAQQQWFGGRPVETSGIAGVAVLPEARGTGLTRLLLTHVLGTARERGAALATLFRTIPEVYRRVGWEQVGALTWKTLPASTLAGLRPDSGTVLRAATAADLGAIRDLYRADAREGNGLMERSGPLFPDAEALSGSDGVTLAVGRSGEPEGYAAWRRGSGYGTGATLTVLDLVARTRSAQVSLLAMLGSWASVTPTLTLRLPDPDPVEWLLPLDGLRVQDTHPWMLRVIDVPAAVAARGWPAHLEGSVSVEVVDDDCPWNSGSWTLTVGGGEGRAEPGGPGEVRMHVRGLSVLFAGGTTCAQLRRAGLVEGGGPTSQGWLDAAFAGPRPSLLDYF